MSIDKTKEPAQENYTPTPILPSAFFPPYSQRQRQQKLKSQQFAIEQHPLTREKIISSARQMHPSTKAENDCASATLAMIQFLNTGKIEAYKPSKKNIYHYEDNIIKRKDATSGMDYWTLEDHLVQDEISFNKNINSFLEPMDKTYHILDDEKSKKRPLLTYEPILSLTKNTADILMEHARANDGLGIYVISLNRCVKNESDNIDVGHLICAYVVTPEFNEKHGSKLKKDELITYIDLQRMNYGSSSSIVANSIEELELEFIDPVKGKVNDLFDHYVGIICAGSAKIFNSSLEWLESLINKHKKIQIKTEKIEPEITTTSLPLSLPTIVPPTVDNPQTIFQTPTESVFGLSLPPTAVEKSQNTSQGLPVIPSVYLSSSSQTPDVKAVQINTDSIPDKKTKVKKNKRKISKAVTLTSKKDPDEAMKSKKFKSHGAHHSAKYRAKSYVYRINGKSAAELKGQALKKAIAEKVVIQKCSYDRRQKRIKKRSIDMHVNPNKKLIRSSQAETKVSGKIVIKDNQNLQEPLREKDELTPLPHDLEQKIQKSKPVAEQIDSGIKEPSEKFKSRSAHHCANYRARQGYVYKINGKSAAELKGQALKKAIAEKVVMKKSAYDRSQERIKNKSIYVDIRTGKKLIGDDLTKALANGTATTKYNYDYIKSKDKGIYVNPETGEASQLTGKDLKKAIMEKKVIKKSAYKQEPLREKDELTPLPHDLKQKIQKSKPVAEQIDSGIKEPSDSQSHVKVEPQTTTTPLPLSLPAIVLLSTVDNPQTVFQTLTGSGFPYPVLSFTPTTALSIPPVDLPFSSQTPAVEATQGNEARKSKKFKSHSAHLSANYRARQGYVYKKNGKSAAELKGQALKKAIAEKVVIQKCSYDRSQERIRIKNKSIYVHIRTGKKLIGDDLTKALANGTATTKYNYDCIKSKEEKLKNKSIHMHVNPDKKLIESSQAETKVSGKIVIKDNQNLQEPLREKDELTPLPHDLEQKIQESKSVAAQVYPDKILTEDITIRDKKIVTKPDHGKTEDNRLRKAASANLTFFPSFTPVSPPNPPPVYSSQASHIPHPGMAESSDSQSRVKTTSTHSIYQNTSTFFHIPSKEDMGPMTRRYANAPTLLSREDMGPMTRSNGKENVNEQPNKDSTPIKTNLEGP